MIGTNWYYIEATLRSKANDFYGLMEINLPDHRPFSFYAISVPSGSNLEGR